MSATCEYKVKLRQNIRIKNEYTRLRMTVYIRILIREGSYSRTTLYEESDQIFESNKNRARDETQQKLATSHFCFNFCLDQLWFVCSPRFFKFIFFAASTK